MINDSLPGEIIKEVGLKLKALRKSKKLTQEELGQTVGVSRQHIIDIEAGRGTSLLIFIKILREFRKTEKLIEILDAISISPKELFLKENK